MAQVTWKTGTSGSWQTAANWTGGVLPGTGDDALLTAAGSYVVTSTSFEQVNSVQTAAGVTLDINAGGFQLNAGTGSGANAGTIQIDNANQLILAGGTLNNTGSITENSTGNTTQITITAPSVTLTGGGSIVMSANGANYIDGNNAGFQLINVNNTISGAGNLGNNDLTIINQSAGVIDANSTATLNVQTQNLLTNAGLMEATAGGIMAINSTGVNNAGGKVLADGGTVDLNSSTIFGGTIQTLHGGVFQTTSGSNAIDGITFGAVTLAGTVTVNNATNLVLAGTIKDAGSTIQVSGSTNTTQLQLGSNQVTLTGGGAIVLSNSDNNYIQSGSGNFQQQLINVDNTISGSGHIGNNNMTLINDAKGVIDATNAAISGSSGVLHLSVNGGVTNFGLIEDTGTAGLAIDSTNVYQSGTKATIEAKGAGSHVDLNSSNIVGGTLTTTGTGVIQTTSGTSQLDGLNSGMITNKGKFLINNATDLNVAGVLNNTGSMSETSSGNTTEFRLNSWVVTLQGGGTLTLSDNANNYILAAFSGWQTFDNVNNTISGSGDIGNGSMQFVNGGTVNATGSVAQLIINLGGSSTGINNAGGVWEGTGTQGLQITNGFYTNNGTVEALNGSSVVYTSSASNLNLSGGTLTGGTWEAIATGAGTATVAITGGSVVTDAAAIFLSGTGSVFEAGNGNTFAAIETTLTTIAAGGSLAIEGGRVYTTTLSLTDSGTLTLAGAATTLTATALTVASGGLLTGNGVIKNSVTNSGSVVAAGGVLDFTKNLTGAGTATINTHSTLEVNGTLSTKNVVFGAGAGEVLQLTKPSTTTSTIAGFGTNTTIDLLNIGVTSLTYAGNTTSGTLTIKSGTSVVGTLKFSGNYTTASFSFGTDGNNGTNIVGTGHLTADLTSVGGFDAAAWTAHPAAPTLLATSGGEGSAHSLTPVAASDAIHVTSYHPVY